MPTPISERVMTAIAAQLATITTGNGYSISPRVLRSLHIGSASQLPAIVLWDAGEIVKDSSKRKLEITLSVEVIVFVMADQGDTGTKLETVKADVKKALLSWAQDGISDNVGQIGKLSYESATLQVRDDGDQTESVSLKFSATYCEGNGDPYSNAFV